MNCSIKYFTLKKEIENFNKKIMNIYYKKFEYIKPSYYICNRNILKKYVIQNKNINTI